MSNDKEDTCLGKECPFYSMHEGKQMCPNYMETVWVNEQDSQPKIVKDCAPKRSVLMMMEMHNHLIGYKQYACETRNMLQKLNDDTREFIAVQDGSNNSMQQAVRRIESQQERLIKDQNVTRENHDIRPISDLRST